MQKLFLFVDKVSTWVGQTFSWLIMALTLMITWEVFSRYVLDHPHPWAFDVMIMMYNGNKKNSAQMISTEYTTNRSGVTKGLGLAPLGPVLEPVMGDVFAMVSLLTPSCRIPS